MIICFIVRRNAVLSGVQEENRRQRRLNPRPPPPRTIVQWDNADLLMVFAATAPTNVLLNHVS